MAREFEYHNYFIRIEEHPNVFLARIYEDITEPPLAHLESGPRAQGIGPVMAAAKPYIDEIKKKKPR